MTAGDGMSIREPGRIPFDKNLRKPLTEWVAAPRWLLTQNIGEMSTQLNLAAWAVEGPTLCWPEDLPPRAAPIALKIRYAPDCSTGWMDAEAATLELAAEAERSGYRVDYAYAPRAGMTDDAEQLSLAKAVGSRGTP